MRVEKGDLILAASGGVTSTCIVLTVKYTYEFKDRESFYYTYCLETGLYGVVYTHEIISVVSKGFAPDFKFDSQIFDTNYDFYESLYDNFSYWPYFWSAKIEDEDDLTTEESNVKKVEINPPEEDN